MKKRNYLLVGLMLVATFLILTLNSEKKDRNSKNTRELTTIEKQFIQNSKLTKKQRKARGLPPNAYFEQRYLKTVNPNTGLLEPNELNQIRNSLLNDYSQNRVSGDGSLDNWVELGPNTVGGRTRVLQFVPGSETEVFAGAVTGGLWYNSDITNATNAWQRVEGIPSNLAVTCFTVDPNDPNKMYLGTGEIYTYDLYGGNGVYMSEDGGQRWQLVCNSNAGNVNQNITNPQDQMFFVQDIIAWNNPATNSTEVFFGAGSNYTGYGSNASGLFRSTDGGDSFTKINNQVLRETATDANTRVTPNKFAVGADGRLWMGTHHMRDENGAFSGGGKVFSTINGVDWTENHDFNTDGRVELVASATNADRIYALVQNNNQIASGQTGAQFIARTDDGFATAPTILANPNDPDPGINQDDFARGQSFYDLMIGIDPTDDDNIFVGGINIHRTNDAGVTWTTLSAWHAHNSINPSGLPVVHADQHCMAFAPFTDAAGVAQLRTIFGNDGGIFISNDNGVTFEARNQNYNVTQFYSATSLH